MSPAGMAAELLKLAGADADRDAMARVLSFPAIKARERRWDFLRDQWLFVAVVTAVFISASMVIYWLWPDWRVPGWSLPMGLAAAAAGVGHTLFDGTYYLWVADLAEKWTMSELRKLKRHGWGVVGRVPFEFKDVDHVAIRGSIVIAIDTKYTDSEIDLTGYRDRETVQQMVQRARDSARSLEPMLRQCHGLPVRVRVAVAVWGSQVTGEPQFVDGVLVVKAGQLGDELRRRCVSDADEGLTRRTVATLEDFRRRRARDARRKRWAWRH